MYNSTSRQLPLVFNVTQIPEDVGTGYLDNLCVIFDNITSPWPVLKEREQHVGFPVKCESFFVVAVLRGSVRLVINLREEEVCAGQMLMMMPGSIFQHHTKSEDAQVFSMVLDVEFVNMMRKHLGVRLPFIPGYYHHVIIPLSEERMKMNLEIYLKVKEELQQRNYPMRKEVVQRYLEIMMLKNYAMSEAVDKPELNGKPINRKEQIFHDFLALLEKNYTQERSISFYADRMCLTPKYLSTIIKEVSGKHGMQWIDEFVSLEAKALLRNSDLSVKQVSDQLNFPSQSMFGRFFKKMTGYSPKQYKML